MDKVILLLVLLTVVTIFPLAASAQSDTIPSWIKNNAAGICRYSRARIAG